MKKRLSLLGIGIIAFLWLYHCPIQRLTGFPCPGCNMTTALYYALKGDWQTSLYFHALLWPTLIIGLGLLILWRFHKYRWIHWLLVLWCLAMVGYYIYRMVWIFPQFPMAYDQSALVPLVFEKLGIISWH